MILHNPSSTSPGRIYKFRRTALINFTCQNNVGGVVFYTNNSITNDGFQLTYVPASTDFTNLFDQYRIRSVTMTWHPTASQVAVGADADHQLPDLYTVIDQNDGTVPTTVTTLLQYQTLKVARFDKPYTRRFEPRVALATFQGGVSTAYSDSEKAIWIDKSYPSVQQYACKWALVWPAAGTSSVTQYFQLTMQYELEFRCVN
jgi:hypothetical protein